MPEYFSLVNRSYRDGEGSCTPDPKQALDLFRPNDSMLRPLIVWIHGGGWHKGDRAIPLRDQCLARGFAVASIGYRFTTDGHPFPAQIEDCLEGLAWLIKNAARYRLDTERIGVVGHSAGAHLAALIATAGSSDVFRRRQVKVKAGVLWSAPLDLSFARGGWPETSAFLDPQDPFQKWFFPGGVYEEEFALWASPRTYISKSLPSLLIVHHEQDPLVPVQQAAGFVRTARRLGNQVRFRIESAPCDHPHNLPSNGLYEEAFRFLGEKLDGSSDDSEGMCAAVGTSVEAG